MPIEIEGFIKGTGANSVYLELMEPNKYRGIRLWLPLKMKTGEDIVTILYKNDENYIKAQVRSWIFEKKLEEYYRDNFQNQIIFKLDQILEYLGRFSNLVSKS